MQTKTILGVTLAAQLLLAGGLFASRAGNDAGQAPAPWLAFPASDVTRIVIADANDSTTLARTGEQWQLSDMQLLPANQGRITTLLDDFGKLSTRWPVAQSASSRERFEVSEEKFQRHLQLYNGDTLLGDYYFGTSPGFRQTHARRNGEDAVYALAFNNFDLPVDDNDWLDKGLLKVSDIDRIEGDGYLLTGSNEDWQLAPGNEPDATAFDNSKAKTLATALQGLQVLRVADSVPAGESRSVTVAAGDMSWVFRFTKADTSYYVQRSDIEQAFTISAADYDRIAGLSRGSLLQAAAVTPTTVTPTTVTPATDTGATATTPTPAP
jgi:hypothetical protein